MFFRNNGDKSTTEIIKLNLCYVPKTKHFYLLIKYKHKILKYLFIQHT